MPTRVVKVGTTIVDDTLDAEDDEDEDDDDEEDELEACTRGVTFGGCARLLVPFVSSIAKSRPAASEADRPGTFTSDPVKLSTVPKSGTDVIYMCVSVR
jgi:hypothetical protein